MIVDVLLGNMRMLQKLTIPVQNCTVFCPVSSYKQLGTVCPEFGVVIYNLYRFSIVQLSTLFVL